MHDQFVFNGRRGHIFALAGFEQVFDTPGDAQVALGVKGTFVAGAQPSIGGEDLAGLLGLFVVAQHQRRAAHLDFASLRVDTVLHAGVGGAHRAFLVLAG